MAKKQTFEVRLLGQRIQLKASETNSETIEEVIELATSRLEAAEKRGKGLVAHQVALLALMDLAEEYVNAKHRTAEFHEQMDEKSKQILGLIEAELK